MRSTIILALSLTFLFQSCQLGSSNNSQKKDSLTTATTTTTTTTETTKIIPDSGKAKGNHDSGTSKRTADSGTTMTPSNQKIADAAAILGRKEVPILCYHHIRPESKGDYTVTTDKFKEQMKALADAGYHTVLPEQLYNYLALGASLPTNPFMITYDDTDEEQFTIGKTEMDKYNFKGVYFLMSISIGRPRYMTKEQIKQLTDEGNAVECHTWDHYMITKYTDKHEVKLANGKTKIVNDWVEELDKPKKTIEAITGKPIYYFAYPFGVWNTTAIPELKQRGYKLAFQLSTKRDPNDPLYTVRRIIVDPHWSGQSMVKAMQASFR